MVVGRDEVGWVGWWDKLKHMMLLLPPPPPLLLQLQLQLKA